MAVRGCRVILLVLVSSASAQVPRDATAYHPDGTPIFPEELRDVIRKAVQAGSEVSVSVRDVAMGNDLEAFTDVMQKHNYDSMFADDGSLYDIGQWRKMYSDDAFYSKLMEANAPDQHKIIMTGTDEQVQDLFRKRHQAARAKMEL